MRRVRFEDIREFACRWPLGDPRSGEFTYCGLTPAKGQSYCAGHCRMAYRAPQPRGIARERGLRAIARWQRSSRIRILPQETTPFSRTSAFWRNSSGCLSPTRSFLTHYSPTGSGGASRLISKTFAASGRPMSTPAGRRSIRRPARPRSERSRRPKTRPAGRPIRSARAGRTSGFFLTASSGTTR